LFGTGVPVHAIFSVHKCHLTASVLAEHPSMIKRVFAILAVDKDFCIGNYLPLSEPLVHVAVMLSRGVEIQPFRIIITPDPAMQE
jgi:hypothetical protein